MMALAAATLAAPIALAQVNAPPSRTGKPPTSMAGTALRPVTSIPPLSPAGPGAAASTPAPKDNNVFEASTALPALLTRDNGPFMVMAKTFRGPDAERWAVALVLELRNDHNLPAYILRTRDFPLRSNIRNVPPTAEQQVRKPYLTEPEKARTHDEAIVLVGDEKTLKGSEVLLHKVKKIKPKCLNANPSIYHWRQGLNTALRTTNPFVPTQDLFSGKGDPLLRQINGGPHNLVYCPGRYSLQVAEFSGRATFNVDNPNFKDSLLAKSPLARAADDAEQLADKLAKNPEIRQTGCQPYVFHDRTSSKVWMGAFNSPDDPAAARLRDTLLKLAASSSLMKEADDTMIVPAPYLTDVDVLKAAVR
jgi:hypothetical protein